MVALAAKCALRSLAISDYEMRFDYSIEIISDSSYATSCLDFLKYKIFKFNK